MEKVYEDIKTEKENDPNIVELVADYVDTYYKLTVVNISQKAADASATVSFSILATFVIFFICLFVGIGACLWLGELLKSYPLGFFAFSGFCLIIFLILFLTRKKVFYPFIKNLVIKSI